MKKKYLIFTIVSLLIGLVTGILVVVFNKHSYPEQEPQLTTNNSELLATETAKVENTFKFSDDHTSLHFTEVTGASLFNSDRHDFKELLEAYYNELYLSYQELGKNYVEGYILNNYLDIYIRYTHYEDANKNTEVLEPGKIINNLYLTVRATFDIVDGTDYKELSRLAIFFTNEHGNCLYEMASITASETKVTNPIIFMDGTFYENGGEAYITANKLRVGDSLFEDAPKEEQKAQLVNANCREVDDGLENEEKLNRIFSSIQSLLTVNHDFEVTTDEIGYYYNSDGWNNFKNGIYPDFNNEFNQNAPICEIYNKAAANGYELGLNALLIEWTFTDTLTMNNRYIYCLVGCERTYDVSIGNYIEYDDPICLIELIDGKFVILDEEVGPENLEKLILNLEGKIYGMNDYQCMNRKPGTVISFEGLTDIGEYDFPTYISGMLFAKE